MRIIDKKTLLALVISLAVFLPRLTLPGSVVSKPVGEYHLLIGAMAGYFYPSQSSFRKIYNKPLWPVELQLGWTLSRKMSVFGSVRYLETSGKTVLLTAQNPEETYALRWRIATLRLGMNYWLRPFRFTPFLGAGVSYSFYQEHWLEAPLVNEDKKTGFFIQAGARYRLSRRLHALAQLEYSSVPAGSGAQGRVNLGGLNLSLGLMAGIF
jgi:opacity protein-like surface antigen